MIDWHYSLVGVLVGLVVGLTGVGGGSLMTPLLVLVFGVAPTTAVGTDLLYASATKAVGTTVHGWRGTVSWRVVSRLAMGSVPATIVTLLAIGASSKAHTGYAISVILGIVLILSALTALFRARIVAFVTPRVDPVGREHPVALTILLGAVLGAMVSLTSVGAGALGMTALLILYPNMPVNKLVGSDIAHAVPLTLLAGTGHWLLGSVDGALLVSLLCGSIPGIIVGSLISSRISDRFLSPILAAVLLLVGIRLLF